MGGYIQADETPVAVQKREVLAKKHQGYLWSYSRPAGPVIFDFQMNRARAGSAAFLEHYDGILQHDGYEAYVKVGGTMIHVACMAHIRRGFWDAWKVGEQRAEKVVRAIKRLYKIERFAREEKLSASDRHELRSRRSAPRMKLLKQRIEKLLLEVLPQSKVGQACTYALGQWSAMERYLEDGRIELDVKVRKRSPLTVPLGL